MYFYPFNESRRLYIGWYNGIKRCGFLFKIELLKVINIQILGYIYVKFHLFMLYVFVTTVRSTYVFSAVFYYFMSQMV